MCCISGKTFWVNKKNKPMSELEKNRNLITMLYRDAKDKKNEIKILSELFSEEKSKIAAFLLKQGYDDIYIRKYL